MNAWPVIEPCRLGEIALDLPIPQLVAAFLAVARPWEIGFLEDVEVATARKDAHAYKMSVNGELGPLVVDHECGGGHMLTMEATREFERLGLVICRWPKCDGSCGIEDDDDEWPSPPGDCFCDDAEPSVSLSERGKAILAASKAVPA